MVNNDVDEHLVRELILYYKNSRVLYQISQFWEKNYSRKIKSGRYGRNLAVKGIAENFVPRIITHYNKSVTKLPNIDRATKYAMAELWIREFEYENKITTKEYNETK